MPKEKQNPESSSSKKSKKHTTEEKEAILKKLENKTQSEVIAETNISESTLNDWVTKKQAQNPKWHPYKKQRKITIKEIWAILEKLENKTLSEVAAESKISITRLRQLVANEWAQNPKWHPPKKYWNYTTEEKEAILKKLENKTLSEVAAESNISEGILYYWVIKKQIRNPTWCLSNIQLQENIINAPTRANLTESQQFTEASNQRSLVGSETLTSCQSHPQAGTSKQYPNFEITSSSQQVESTDLTMSSTSSSDSLQAQQLQVMNEHAPSSVENPQHYKKKWIRKALNATMSNPQYQETDSLDLTMPSTSSGIQHPKSKPFVSSETANLSINTPARKETEKSLKPNVEEEFDFEFIN